MIQSSIKIVFAFVMALSLMAPVMAPFCSEELYEVVMMGSNNEEESQDHQNETTKKLSEKDLFLQHFTSMVFTLEEKENRQFGYLFHLQPIEFDIILPPPERVS